MRIASGSLGRCRLRITALALGLLVAAALGFGAEPARAQDIKPDHPEQRQVFEALDQWMRQNTASVDFDPPTMQDHFTLIKEVLGHTEEPEEDPEPGCRRRYQPLRTPIVDPVLIRLKLTAIITLNGHPGSQLAAFEDNTGDSFIVRRGDLIGRSFGRVKEITNSTVTVETWWCGDPKPDITHIELQTASLPTPQGNK